MEEALARADPSNAIEPLPLDRQRQARRKTARGGTDQPQAGRGVDPRRWPEPHAHQASASARQRCQWTVRQLQCCKRSFLASDDLDGVVSLGGESSSRAHHACERLSEILLREQRHPDGSLTSGANAGWLTHDIERPRADKAVADSKVMIQEGQRPIRGQRREPERQAGELYGRGVSIHAVEASLRDRAGGSQPSPPCRPDRRATAPSDSSARSYASAR